MRFLDSDDSDDPILSVVNVIDVFLVIVVMLLIVVAHSSATALAENAPEADSGDVVPETVQTLERYQTTGEMGEGTGVRAGTTYRLEDGTMVFVPD